MRTRTLHVSFRPERHLLARLDAWDEAVRRDARLRPGSWRLLVLWRAAQSATVSASTGIEGNPLGPDDVEAVLSGTAVDASADDVQAVLNYNDALTLARDIAPRTR